MMHAHRLLTYSAIGALLVMGFVVYLHMFSPFTAAPEIARNLPLDMKQADAEFGVRIRAAFSAGMQTADALDKLKTEGFELGSTPELPGLYFASFTMRKFPCDYLWSIRLKTAADVISDIAGRYSAQCL